MTEGTVNMVGIPGGWNGRSVLTRRWEIELSFHEQIVTYIDFQSCPHVNHHMIITWVHMVCSHV